MKKIVPLVLVMLFVLTIGFPATASANAEEVEVLDNSVYSSQGVTLTMGSFEYDKSWGGYYYVDLTIVNDSLSEIEYDVEYLLLNGFQFPVSPCGRVYSQMEDETQVVVDKTDFNRTGIEQIQSIEMGVQLYDRDNNKKLEKVMLWRKAENYVKPSIGDVFEGKEIYNEDGLRFLAHLGGDDEKDPVFLGIENNSGRRVMLFFEDIAINKKMVSKSTTGYFVEDGAIMITTMDRIVLQMETGSIPENKDITTVSFKIDIVPFRTDGTTSSGDAYESNRIDLE